MGYERDGRLSALSDHIAAHPIRLVVTMIIPLFLTAALALYAISSTVQSNAERNAEICRQVNQLRETLYITTLDFGRASDLPPRQQQVLAQRFLPFEDCEVK